MHTAVRGTINVVGEMYETHFRFQISLAGQGRAVRLSGCVTLRTVALLFLCLSC